MSGYIKLHRQIFDSAIWQSDSDLLKLFLYLLGKAFFMESKFQGLNIERGEVLTSISIIADDCMYSTRYGMKKWSRTYVYRMLAKLEAEPYSMVEILSDARGTHIRILNYEKYQGTDEKVKRKKIELSTEGFDEWWELYPRKDAKKKALETWGRLAPDEELRAKMMTVLQAQVIAWRDREKKHILLPTTYLNGQRWEDEVKSPTLGRRIIE